MPTPAVPLPPPEPKVKVQKKRCTGKSQNASLTPHILSSPKPSTPFQCHTPYTAPWVAARLKDSPVRAVSILRSWSHSKRWREIHDDTVRKIAEMSDTDTIA